VRLLATFESSHAALRAEARMKAQGLPVELIPVPRQINSECGFCLLCETEDPEDLRETGTKELWKVLEPDPEHPWRRYEPCT